MPHQQIHGCARLPQNIAKEIALFAAEAIHHLPQRLQAGGCLDAKPGLFGEIAVFRSPAGKGLRVVSPLAGVDQFLFFFQRAAYRIVKGDELLGINALSSVSSASRSCFRPCISARAVVGGTEVITFKTTLKSSGSGKGWG